MIRTQYIIYSLLLILVISSCRKDVFVDNPDTTVPNPNLTITTDVMGQIVDLAGTPIEGAEISISNEATQTNAQGSFLFRLLDINDAGTLVKIEKNGYFAQTRIIYPNKPKETCFLKATLIEKGNPTKFQSNTDHMIEMNGGAKVEFKANSISYEGGSSYTGEVLVFTHWYDPTSTELASEAPANLEAINLEGDKVILDTYGMVAVELQTPDGSPLQLTNGETAKLSFPLDAELDAQGPDMIPLWYLDEEKGMWVEESAAAKSNGFYIGEVSHFSFWNADYANTFIKIEGYLTDDSGVPIANYPIHIRRNNATGAYGFTNSLGFFEGLVPNDEVLTMYIWHCGTALVNTEIGPFSSDTDLGTLQLTLTDFATTLEVDLKGCVGEALPFAYGILNNGQFLVPDQFGSISTVVAGCGTFQPSVKFYDGVNLNESDDFPIDKTLAVNDLSDVTLCNNIGFYVSWSEDGGNPFVIADPQAFIVNNNQISIRARQLSSVLRYDMDLIGTTTGTYNPFEVDLNSPDAGGPNGEAYLACSESEYLDFECDQYTVEILEVDLVDNIVTGTFSGLLISTDTSMVAGTPVFVEGSFRSEIVDIFNEASVSGKIWIDLNDNGTRDTDEEGASVCNMNFTLAIEDGNPMYFGNYYYNSLDGNITFEGLRPGSYSIRTFTNSYELTDYQSGDPTKDNDFQVIPSTQNLGTSTFTLSDGEVKENVDLGFAKPTAIDISFYGVGCKPDLDLLYGIAGGLKPYQVELSNGFSESTNETYGIIEVTMGGLYELIVTDALGNSSNRSYNLVDYQNYVTGFVWEDDPASSNPDLYEFNIDKPIENVNITLKLSDGTTFGTELTGQNGYRFQNVPDGDYYIEVENLAGYELVDETPGNYLGSQIDQTTYQSDLFTVVSCNSNTNISAGYKLN